MRFLRRAAPTGGAAPSPDPVIALALRGRVDDADALEAAWSAGVGASDVGVRQATLAAAPAVSRALRPRSPDAAVRVAEQALPLLDDPAAGAVLRQVLATVRLDRGDVPTSEELLGIARGLTAASDSLFDAGQRVEALDRVHLALELLLHRTLHADVERSPLLEDPEAWIGEVRRSSAYSWVHGGGARSDRRRPVGRLLLLTKSGSHFAGLPARLAESLGVEVRTHALGDFEPAWPVPHSWRMSAQRARAREGIAPPVPDQARDALAWADQVLVDWCDEAAVAVASALPDDGPELVVRLHSVESLSVPPHFVDWRRVDRLVVVSDHLAAVTRAVLPQTSDVPTVVLPPYAVPADVLDRSAAGDPESERTIAVVGWAQPVKDPIWALDLLARLREVDPSWRLLLVGPWFVEGAGRVGERAYADRFHAAACGSRSGWACTRLSPAAASRWYGAGR